MKKKCWALFIAVGLAVGIAACGNAADSSQQMEGQELSGGQDSQAEGANFESEPVASESQAASETPTETESKPEEPSEEELEINVSVELVERQEEYEALGYLGGNLFLYLDSGALGVIDADGTIVIKPTYDFFVSDMQDGCFVLGNRGEDGYRWSSLYNLNLEEIYSFEGFAHIRGYSNDIIQLTGTGTEPFVRYLDAKKKFALLGELNAQNCRGFRDATCFVNGTAVVSASSWDYPEETEELPVYDFYLKNGKGGSWSPEGINWGFYPWCMPISPNGWVVADETEVYESKGWVLYNVNTGAYHEFRNSAKLVDMSGGAGYCNYGVCEQSGFALISEEGSTQDGRFANLRPFNLESGEFVGSQTFQSLAIQDYGSGLMLFQSDDGKSWGYVDQNFNTVGRLYEEATEFSGNYAMVRLNGGIYVINREMEFVSEKIEGESAFLLTGNLFAVSRNGKCHIVEVKE